LEELNPLVAARIASQKDIEITKKPFKIYEISSILDP
jgi:hypothetical protein